MGLGSDFAFASVLGVDFGFGFKVGLGADGIGNARPPEQGGGQGGQIPPPPTNAFSIAKVPLFDFTSRGKFLSNKYIDRIVAM